MIIDSHHHLWNYDPVTYAWINDEMALLKRDFLPSEYKFELDRNGIYGSVVVQATTTEKETGLLLELSEKSKYILGVVGWVNLLSKDLENKLDAFGDHLKFKGVRHPIQGERLGFMTSKDFKLGLSKLKSYDLPYDLLIYPTQLKEATNLVSEYPNQIFIIDHLAKPAIKDRQFQPWQKEIEKIAKYPNVYCKISGMVTEAKWHRWMIHDFKPYIDIAMENFGAERVMFGSDWPVCLLSATYEQVLTILKFFIRYLSQDEKENILSRNAIRAYQLNIEM